MGEEGGGGIAQNEGSRQMTQLGYANFDVIMYNEYSKGHHNIRNKPQP